MAQTELLSPRSQRSVPIWLLVAMLLLVIARFVSLHSGAKDRPAEDEEGNPIVAAPPSAAPASVDAPSLVHWVSLADAGALAAQTHRPILYEFGAAWCGPCHMMEAEVFNDPKLAAMINQRYVPVRIVDRHREDGRNADDVEELQQRYQVQGFPTLVVASADGTALESMTGYGGPDRTGAMLAKSWGQ